MGRETAHYRNVEQFYQTKLCDSRQYYQTCMTFIVKGSFYLED